ncbi:MAG: gliding motility-associated protein GldE [Bacteroidetes bacterium]|nr:gliding motility-associated protein GldE [Bacteroidota bacterium]MBS1629438.1 gliding motility-associated protein GldE [Bacteroidota bacterium]
MESASDGGGSTLHLLLQASGGPISPSNLTVLVIIILILLLLTAITAGAETAFFSLKAKDINYLKTKEQPAARQAVRLLDQPKMLLATILVANNFVNIAIIIATNLLIRHLLPPELSALWSFLIQVVAVTFLLVLFGEVLPKVYATQNNMRMALFSAPVITSLTNVFRPLSRTLVRSTNYIEERLARQKAGSGSLSTEDFEQAIELTVGHTATREEVNIFKGILKFGNITARQVMRGRLDVCALNHEMTFPEVQRYAIEVGYSRMPVFNENLDKVAGMIHTKDFLPHGEDDHFDWHKLIRPAYFVHEGKLIEDLLKEFQQKRIHLAVVVDEFGGTSGIITLEDIMEEIIGDIKDEFDDDDLQARKIDDYNFLFEGKTLINDACRIMGLPTDTFDEARGESDSLGGLILEISGRFPVVNETLRSGIYEFTVLEVDKMRIKRVKVTIDEQEHREEEV